MPQAVLPILIGLNRILTAGIAVLSFSLVLYSLTFNLKDRVARAFAIIMACVTMVFIGDAVSSITIEPQLLEFWLKLQWVGIIFLPFAYFYFSDALLATTGRPSRGRRRIVVRVSLLISCVFFVLMIFNILIGEVVTLFNSAPFLRRTWVTWIFIVYYGLMMIWSGVNFFRAYRRSVTSAGKRRMVYLMAGATAPALGSFPFLLFGANVAANHHFLFWLAVVLSNGLSSVLIVLMAYAVAFFGVDQPDRVVKSRLFRWVFRGPITAIVILILITITRQLLNQMGYSAATIEVVIITAGLLFMQYFITLIAPYVEKKLFLRGDEEVIKIIQNIEEHAITPTDLLQFLEAVLASACDRLRSAEGFIAQYKNNHLDVLVKMGDVRDLDFISPAFFNFSEELDGNRRIILFNGYWLIPLAIERKSTLPNIENHGNPTELEMEPSIEENAMLLGVMGVSARKQKRSLMNYVSFSEFNKVINKGHYLENTCTLEKNQIDGASSELNEMDDADQKALMVLAQRASSAIQNHSKQQQWFSALQELSPQIEGIQRLRAAASYNGTRLFTNNEKAVNLIQPNVLKEALDHFWGGPKLTQSPLTELKIVKDAMSKGETAANALREILRNAIESLKPSGEKRYTAEWLLYNLLSLKYYDGVKVRDIAHRLAISEADFYRKQRTALDLLARRLQEMEENYVISTSNTMEGQKSE